MNNKKSKETKTRRHKEQYDGRGKWVAGSKGKRGKYEVMEENVTLGGGHAMQRTNDTP